MVIIAQKTAGLFQGLFNQETEEIIYTTMANLFAILQKIGKNTCFLVVESGLVFHLRSQKEF